MNPSVSSLSEDERTFAALAHGSILLGIFTGGFGGIITALIIWLAQKEKSAFVGRQALQALIYQSALLILSIVAWVGFIFTWLGGIMVPLFLDPAVFESQTPPAFLAFLIPALLCGIFLLVLAGALFVLYGLWAAYQTYLGHDFRYAIVGNWLK